MAGGWLSSRSALLAAVTVGIILAWVVLDALIVTDRERVEGLIQERLADFAARRVDAAMAFVAEDFQNGRDRAAFRAQAEAFLTQYDPARMTYAIRSVAFEGDSAETAVVGGICLVHPGPRSQFPSLIRGTVTLRLRREPAGDWRLTGLKWED